MKYGFELEFFCEKVDPTWDGTLKEGMTDSPMVPCLVPAGLPYDECGWLVEVRSEPHADLRCAIALLQAEVEKVTEQAKAKGNTARNWTGNVMKMYIWLPNYNALQAFWATQQQTTIEL